MEALKEREHEELEAAVQELIKIATSSHLSLSSDFTSLSMRKLLEKVSGEPNAARASAPIAASSAASLQACASGTNTILLVQKRLNAEYRHFAAMLRETHDDRMQVEKKKVLEREKQIRSTHLEALKRIASMRVATQEIEIPLVKAPSAKTVEIFEKKLSESSTPSKIGAPAIGDALDPATKKVITFWKSRYQTAAKQLEDVLTDISTANAKCAQQVELRGASGDTLDQMLQTLKEAESRERHRLDELHNQYFDECRRRGLEPKEPLLAAEDRDMSYDPTTGRMTEVREDKGALKVIGTLINEQKRKNRDLSTQASQIEARLRTLTTDSDDLLERYAAKAGQYRGPGSQLLEEVVALLAECEHLESSYHDNLIANITMDMTHMELMNRLREEHHNTCRRLRGEVEHHKALLQNLEVRLVCANRPLNEAGQYSVSSLEDESIVLSSRIAVVENEISVLRSERAALTKVGDELSRRVDNVLADKQAMLQLRGLTASTQEDF